MMNLKKVIEDKNGNAYAHLKEQFQMAVVVETLKLENGSSWKSAERLGVSRSQFRIWCKHYGIVPKHYKLQKEEYSRKKGFPEGYRERLEQALYRTSITKAALKLNMNQSTLYRHAKALEII